MEKKNIIIVVGIAVLAMIALCGCGPTEKEFEDMVNQRVATALETAEKARRAKPQVIEVRIPEEYSNAVIQRVVVNNNNTTSASTNDGDIRTPVQVKIDEHIKKQEAAQQTEQKVEAPKCIDNLNEEQTLTVLKANHQMALEELQAAQKRLNDHNKEIAAIDQQINAGDNSKETYHKKLMLKWQGQRLKHAVDLANNYVVETKTKLDAFVQAVEQRDKAVEAAKAAKPAKAYAWYNPKGWWN